MMVSDLPLAALPFADAVLKATVILAGATVASFCLRRRTAAVRHLVWTLALGGALTVPLLSFVLPKWQMKDGDAAVRRHAIIAIAELGDGQAGSRWSPRRPPNPDPNPNPNPRPNPRPRVRGDRLDVGRPPAFRPAVGDPDVR